MQQRWTHRSTTNSTVRSRRRPSRRHLRRARVRGGSRATATPQWWGPVDWPAPRWVLSRRRFRRLLHRQPAARTPGVLGVTDQSPADAVNRFHDAAAFTVGGTAAWREGFVRVGFGFVDPGLAGCSGSRAGERAACPGRRRRRCDPPGGATGTGSGNGSGTGTGTTPPVGTDPGSDCTASQGDLGLNCMLDSLTTHYHTGERPDGTGRRRRPHADRYPH